MLKRILQRLDDFEDEPVAPVVGAIVLLSLLIAGLLVPASEWAVIP